LRVLRSRRAFEFGEALFVRLDDLRQGRDRSRQFIDVAPLLGKVAPLLGAGGVQFLQGRMQGFRRLQQKFDPLVEVVRR